MITRRGASLRWRIRGLCFLIVDRRIRFLRPPTFFPLPQSATRPSALPTRIEEYTGEKRRQGPSSDTLSRLRPQSTSSLTGGRRGVTPSPARIRSSLFPSAGPTRDVPQCQQYP